MALGPFSHIAHHIRAMLIRITKKLDKTESLSFFISCVLYFQRQPYRFLVYIAAAGVKCRVAAVKHLPVLNHSADYISTSFGITEPSLVTLKIEHHLSRR